MNELEVLVLKLRMLTDDSRDTEDKDLYHNTGEAAQFAADFDDLDTLMQKIYPEWPRK